MFKWRQGLDERFRGARYFYGVIILSTVVGIAMDFVGINPVKALLHCCHQWRARAIFCLSAS
ncbi:MAG: hypothetical protein DME91_00540 [Verrucomicrobia bacterium]|nr:MAG: hypothetical protein DME91_00540 [Verrucomicrobiota bacterium]